MDTVTSAWSVVTTAYTVIDFFMSVASADEDCKQLVRELYTTTRMINNIRQLAEENAEKLEQLNALLVPGGGLDQFRHTVDELSSRILKSNGTIKEAYKRVKFVLRHQTIQELLQSVQRQQIPFIACLGAENTKLLLQLTADISALSSEMQHLTAQASSIGNTLPDNDPSEIKHPFLVPFSQDTQSLVVRDTYHKAIESKFGTCTRITLYGLGGSGKSRLAIEFAYRHKNACPVFWVYAGSDAVFRGSYGKIAQIVPARFRKDFEERNAIETSGHRKDVASFNMRLATAWLEHDTSGDWVIVLDNVDNPSVLHRQGNDPSIMEQLPMRSKGKVLATSRRKDLALSLSGSENAIIHVDVFPPEEAVECFKQLLPNDNAADGEILSLAKDLGFLPLAIRQAAAYISNQSASIAEYSEYMASSEASKLLLLEQEFRDTMRADDVPNSVLRTWLVSFEQIRHQNEEAANMLCFMATLDRSGVQDLILKEVWKDPLAFRANIGLVLSFSFVGVVGSRKNAYTMHRLIQLSTRAWMKIRGEEDMFGGMALSTIVQLFTDAMAAFRWTDCKMLLPHARALIPTKFYDSKLSFKKGALFGLVKSFEEPPLWQLSSQYNFEVYERLSAMEDLVDISSTLVAHKAFQDWLHGTQPLLFLNGPPGSGKTVACFSVLQYLRSRLDSYESRPFVVYFFFSFNSAGKIDIVKALLLDIISQLCQQMGPANVPERVRTLLVTANELRSRDDLIETVRDLCNDIGERAFVILDGIDECGDEPIAEIMKIISYILENILTLSILVSHRRSAQIDHLISTINASTLSLDNINRAPTIGEYISTRLRDLELPEEQALWIQQHVIDQGKGNFLFTHFLMENLTTNAAKGDDIFQLLRTQPASVSSQYQRTLGNIDPAHREQVSVALRWVVFAFRALTESELSSILDLQCPDLPNPPAMEIVGMTKGLLVTQDVRSDNTQSVASVIRPAHTSVSDFLSFADAGDFQVPHPMDMPKIMLDVCLEVLLEHGDSQSPEAEQHPLLEYAAEFWPKHLDEATKSDLHEESFSNKTNGYLRRLFDATAPNHFLCWLRLSDPAEPELGAQPEKRLEDFKPMEFYVRMFNLQPFMADDKNDSVEEEDQGDRTSSHRLQPSVADGPNGSAEEDHQGDGAGSRRLQPPTADDQKKSGEEDRQGERAGSHRDARHRILCCRPH